MNCHIALLVRWVMYAAAGVEVILLFINSSSKLVIVLLVCILIKKSSSFAVWKLTTVDCPGFVAAEMTGVGHMERNFLEKLTRAHLMTDNRSSFTVRRFSCAAGWQLEVRDFVVIIFTNSHSIPKLLQFIESPEPLNAVIEINQETQRDDN